MQKIVMEFNARFAPIDKDELDSSPTDRRLVVDIVMMFPPLSCVLFAVFSRVLSPTGGLLLENGRIFWAIALVLNFIATCVTFAALAASFIAKSEAPDILAGMLAFVNSAVLIFSLFLFFWTFP